MPAVYRFSITPLSILSLSVSTALAAPQSHAALGAPVVDPLGATVAQPSRSCAMGGRSRPRRAARTGEFTFDAVAEGRYQIEARNRPAEPRTPCSSAPPVMRPLRSHCKSARSTAGRRHGDRRRGAAVSGRRRDHGARRGAIQTLGNTDIIEPLRTVPGVAVVQTAHAAGVVSFHAAARRISPRCSRRRAGHDIGGAFDFADLTTTGVDRVEVLRARTASLRQRRARGRHQHHHDARPLACRRERLDRRGNLGTSREEASLGGAIARFDYFGAFASADRQQRAEQRVSQQHVREPLRRHPGVRTNLGGTVRHIDTTFGSPNAFDYFGVADDSARRGRRRARRWRRTRSGRTAGRARRASASPISSITS